MNDVLVALLQLPHGVKGLVSPTPDGDYRVVLNSRLSAEERREVYNHELRHILENHFSRDGEPVHALEAAAGTPGHLQSVIEKVEEQGLPGPLGPSLALPQAKQASPRPVSASRQAKREQLAWVGPFRAEPGFAAGKTGPPAPTPPKRSKHQAALLRARRAQLTGHWY